MPSFFRATALLLLVCCPQEGFAFGLRQRATTVNAYYYYPTAVLVQPSFQVLPYVPSTPLLSPPLQLCPPETPPPTTPPLATPTTPPLATPTPAPPSSGPASPPPASQPSPTPAPKIKESRSSSDAPPAAVQTSNKPSGERCSVGFWNLTDHDLVLSIDGRSHTVPRGKSLVLDLDHQFTWKVEGREAQLERVPPRETALEIVIRR